jgi:putative ABC transport system substrate-binding protein
MRRREFIALVGGAAAVWPIVVRAQQPAMPVVSFINGGSPEGMARPAAAFRRALQEAGYVEGQNVAVEYHWLEGNYDRVSALIGDLIRRRVAVIAIPGATPATIAAKAATATIPIVFGLGDDPVQLGLVASLARPGGNVTGTNFFFSEAAAKRLGLLHDLVPNASRIAVLVNPSNAANTESILRDLPEAARPIGLQIQILKAGTISEIDEAFAVAGRERADALFLAPDAFFTSRRGQFATLAARDRIPTSCGNREMVEAGLLMSYGANLLDMFRQVGVYTGKILKGAKPAELPVVQSSKFEFVINLQTARALGIEVQSAIQLLADEVIE